MSKQVIKAPNPAKQVLRTRGSSTKVKKGGKIKDGLKKYIKKVDGAPEIDYEAVAESEKFDGVYLMITNTDFPLIP